MQTHKKSTPAPIRIEISAANLSNPEIRKSLLEQIYYVAPGIRDVTFGTDELVVMLGDDTDRDHHQARLTDYAADVIRSFARTKTTVLHEGTGRNLAYQDGDDAIDPFDHLRSTRQVSETLPGTFIIRGELLEVMNHLDRRFHDYARTRNAQEEYYPTSVPTDALMNNGYLKSFPHQAIFAASIREDKASIESLVGRVGPSSDAASETRVSEDGIDFAAHSQVLAPTVCYHTFEGMRGESLTSLPLEITAINKCHRFESRNIQGFERLQTFTMREIVFFGDEKACQTIRQDIMEDCIAQFEAWGIRFRIVSASDPFFSSTAGRKRTFQNAMRLKFEAQCWLPRTQTWLSVASFNLHQQTLVNAYALTADGNGALWSGCVGYGYERMAYALYAQFGRDPATWPDALRKDLS